MKYQGEGFLITISGDTIAFSGKVETNVYTDVLEFLKCGEQYLQSKQIKLDIRQLQFLNSSGIKMLAVFVAGSPKHFNIQIDRQIAWQQNIMPTLQHIKPGGVSILPSE